MVAATVAQCQPGVDGIQCPTFGLPRSVQFVISLGTRWGKWWGFIVRLEDVISEFRMIAEMFGGGMVSVTYEPAVLSRSGTPRHIQS